MTGFENISESLNSLRSNLLRTFLTTLGVIFGVSAVIAMMAIGEGAEKEIMQMINRLGAKNIHIDGKDLSRANLKNIIDKSTGLTLDDTQRLLREFDFIEKIAVLKTLPIRTISLEIPTEKINFLGISPSYLSLMHVALKSGRYFNAQDMSTGRSVCLIDERLKQELWPDEPALNKHIRINQRWLTIIGVTAFQDLIGKDDKKKPHPEEKKKENTDQEKKTASGEHTILIPLQTAFAKTTGKTIYAELDKIIVRVPSLDLTSEYKSILFMAMKRYHNGIEDFEIVAPEELLHQKRKTQNIFNMVLLCIAGISLLVGGIGIMNIMLANILERIKEIGIRRSLGARKRDILSQFLVESVVICSLGGFLGIALGYVIASAIGMMTGWKISMSIAIIVLAFSISLLVGLIFGLLPAQKAANISPIDALRDN